METHEIQEIVAAILAAGASASGIQNPDTLVKAYLGILKSLRAAQTAQHPAVRPLVREKGEPPTFTDR